VKSRVRPSCFLFLLFLSLFFTTSNAQQVSNKQGYILNTKGAELRTSVLQSSSENVLIPYGTKVKVIRTTDSLYTQGLLSCYWQLVAFNGHTGYCPAMYISQHPLPALADTSVKDLKLFLQKSSTKGTYTFNQLNDPDAFTFKDSLYIKDLPLAYCYYLEKRFFSDSDYIFPDTLQEGTINYKFGMLTITTKRSASSGTVNEIKLNWLFDGGTTEMKLRQLKSGTSIVVKYNPD
jgi:hypothetical protein